MSLVTVDDVLSDGDLAATMDPGLVTLLTTLRATARQSGEPATGTFESFAVTVSAGGDIAVNASSSAGGAAS